MSGIDLEPYEALYHVAALVAIGFGMLSGQILGGIFVAGLARGLLVLERYERHSRPSARPSGPRQERSRSGSRGPPQGASAGDDRPFVRCGSPEEGDPRADRRPERSRHAATSGSVYPDRSPERDPNERETERELERESSE